MKRIAVSLSVVAMGAVAAQAGPSDSLSSMQASKPWSVGLSLRGFYDDNYTLSENNELDSWGFEVSPHLSANLAMEQTLITGTYIYSLRDYFDRDDDNIDQSHQLKLGLTHAFSEKYTVGLSERLVVSQEPTLVDAGTTRRTDQSSLRNNAGINFEGEITRQLVFGLSYQNTYVNYDEDAFGDVLNRFEHEASVNLGWRIAPTTKAHFGYIYQVVDYTGDAIIDLLGHKSDDRNSTGHVIYVGVDHAFNQGLTGSIDAGAQFTDYETGDDTSNPWVRGELSYTYAPGSSVSLGVRHSISATDAFQADANGELTQSQETTTLYGTLVHQITPKLTGSLTGTFRPGTFNGGALDGDNESYYGVGLDLSYSINEFLAAEVGYNLDVLDSDRPGRDYTRNRFWIGLTATY